MKNGDRPGANAQEKPPESLKLRRLSDRRAEGRAGEAAVCRWLTARGYTILERNFTVVGGEIDIVASDGENTVFIEVKLRGDDPYRLKMYGNPSAAVGGVKRSRMIVAAEEYMRRFHPPLPPRIDVVEVFKTVLADGFVALAINHLRAPFASPRRIFKS